MKTFKLLAILFLSIGLTNFAYSQITTIKDCYINFKGSKHLVAQKVDKLPKSAVKPRMVKTKDGIKSVSRIAGYRVIYLNKKNAPFVNLKVEQSSPALHKIDQKHVINNLDYLTKNSIDMNSKHVYAHDFEGQEFYEICSSSIEKGSILGSFVLFPGDGTIVYFYFKNLPSKDRTIKSISHYKSKSYKFISKYIKHINNCK